MRQKYNFIPNEVIGILTVLSKSEKTSKDGRALYHVKCNECGYEYELPMRDIHNLKQCKHLRADKNTYQSYYKWGNKRLAHIFRGMLSRCYSVNDKNYKWYGEKGIKVY